MPGNPNAETGSLNPNSDGRDHRGGAPISTNIPIVSPKLSGVELHRQMIALVNQLTANMGSGSEPSVEFGRSGIPTSLRTDSVWERVNLSPHSSRVQMFPRTFEPTSTVIKEVPAGSVLKQDRPLAAGVNVSMVQSTTSYSATRLTMAQERTLPQDIKRDGAPD